MLRNEALMLHIVHGCYCTLTSGMCTQQTADRGLFGVVWWLCEVQQGVGGCFISSECCTLDACYHACKAHQNIFYASRQNESYARDLGGVHCCI
jgi:hypothetical protein